MEILAFILTMAYTAIAVSVAIITVCGAISVLWLSLSTVIDVVKEKMGR